MITRNFLWRRFIVVWAFAVTALYGMVLAEWVKPSIIKWAFPVDWSGHPSNPVLFLLRVIGFAAGAAVFLAAGSGAGAPAGRFLAVPARSMSRDCLLGWFLGGTLLFGLGLNGLFFPAILALVLACFALPGAAVLFRDLTRSRPRIPASLKRHDVWLPLTVVAWIVLLTCLAPETFQDALRYHLFLPKRFLLEHKLFFYEDFFFWSYMGPFHALLASALATGGEIWAKSLNALCGVLALAVLLRIAVLAGLEEEDRMLLLALAATAPGFVLVTGSVFMENEMALALLLAVEFLLVGGLGPSARMRWIALFLSISASVKYTAFFGAAGIAAVLGFGKGREGYPSAPRLARAWVVPALFLVLPMIPWTACRFLWTGDPVSPILARMGARTLDSGSSAALAKAYEFAGKALHRMAENPELLLAYPFDFAGAHGGFWEHPGPAIPMLLPAAVFAFTGLPGSVSVLLIFALGSAGAWLLFFGGVSPHYVAGVTGVWTAAFVGALKYLPDSNRVLFRNLLRFCVMYQALICVVTVTVGWGPKGVAMGVLSKDQYLDGGLEPKGIHHAIRKELEGKYPGRGAVYVYGDDTSYYLSGRVQLDYESGSDPLLWRMARDARTPAELRKRMKQRGWTHVLYSSRWPDEFGRMRELEFSHSARDLALMEDFWREHAEASVVMESPEKGKWRTSCVFEILPSPRAGIPADSYSRRAPIIPGAEGLLWEGDHFEEVGETAAARRSYISRLKKYRGSALLRCRLAALAVETGDCGSAEAFRRELEERGWRLPRLSARVDSCGK